MFPLGSVLFPHAVLPLHVFEPRYRALVEHCLAAAGGGGFADRRRRSGSEADATKGAGAFGVVLIERGSEVGGGDVRFDVGTVARIVQAGRLDDGRWVLMTVGAERLRVTEWLPDDPYPRADVEVIDEPAAPADVSQAIPRVESLLRRVLAMRAELGEHGPAAAAWPTVAGGAGAQRRRPMESSVDVALADDPVRASFEAAARAPLGPLDAQQLLEVDDAAARFARLETLLEDEVNVLAFRLAGD